MVVVCSVLFVRSQGILHGEYLQELQKKMVMGAIKVLEETLKGVEIMFGHDHPRVAFFLDALMKLYLSQGKYDIAEHVCKRALQIR
jgi:hypothetical protein